MTLDNFIEPIKLRMSLKTAIKIMSSKWDEGPRDRFDLKLSRVIGCSIERAEEIRESWVSMGFLAYTRRGLLCWRNRSF